MINSIGLSTGGSLAGIGGQAPAQRGEAAQRTSSLTTAPEDRAAVSTTVSQIAAQGAPLPVEVIDSRSLGMGLGYAVVSAGEAIGCGGLRRGGRVLLAQRQLPFQIRDLLLRVRDLLLGFRQLPLAFRQRLPKPIILSFQPRRSILGA